MRLAWLVLPSLIASAGGAANAQNVQVAPVTIELGSAQQAAVVTVSNQGAVPAMFQVRPFAWSVADNADQLVSTQALAVSPPFVEVAAGQTQTIRLVLRQRLVQNEASFRILIDELPAPATVAAIRIALRLSIPVFAAPAERGDVVLSGRIFVSGGSTTLTVRNRGTQHARTLQATIEPERGQSVSVHTVSSPYVLAGAERTWRVGGNAHLRPGTAAKVIAMTDAGPIEFVVPISPAP